MFSRIHLWSHLVLDFCLSGDGFMLPFFFFCNYRFYFTSSDQSVQIIYFLIQFRWAVSINLSISSRLSNLLVFSCSYYSVFLYIYTISWYYSFFISYFVYLGSVSFLLGEPGQRFVYFVYPIKEPALGCFVEFFLLFSKSLFISSLILVISFLLLTLSSVCSPFSNSFRWEVRLRFLFLREGLLGYKLPFKNCFCCIP